MRYMDNSKTLSMEDFYKLSSCNYLTTFYAETELYSGLIPPEKREAAYAYDYALKWGDYESNPEVKFPIVWRESRYDSGKKMRDILDNRSISFFLISDRLKKVLEDNNIKNMLVESKKECKKCQEEQQEEETENKSEEDGEPVKTDKLEVVYSDIDGEPANIFKHIIVFTNDEDPKNNKTLKNIYDAVEKLKKAKSDDFHFLLR